LICRLRSIPYVVIPHGVYDSALVKDLRLLAVRRRLERFVLEKALAVHLFFEGESGDLREVAPGATPVFAATGLDIPSEQWDSENHDAYFAWLARFDIRHKGIDILLQAIAEIPVERRPQLRMHGPDHRGDKARTRALVSELGLAEWVT